MVFEKYGKTFIGIISSTVGVTAVSVAVEVNDVSHIISTTDDRFKNPKVYYKL